MANSDGGTSLRRRDFCCVQVFGVFMFAIGIVGGILIGIYAYHGENTKENNCSSSPGRVISSAVTPAPTATMEAAASASSCKRPNPLQPEKNPEKQLFATLRDVEVKAVRAFMISKGLITSKLGENITFYDNHLTAIHQFTPNKQAAIDYLYHSGSFPGRFALTYVVRGAHVPPDCMQYVIGPLGSSQMNFVQRFKDGDIAFTSRTMDGWEVLAIKQFTSYAMTTLIPLMKESFDGAYFPGGGLDLRPFNGSPGNIKGERKHKVHVLFNPFMEQHDSHMIDHVPLSATIHCTSQNISEWRLDSFYYLNQGPFQTAEDLMEAYNNGSIRKTVQPKGYKDTIRERIFPTRDPRLSLRENAQLSPPRTYEPDGPRYRIKGGHVKWMGWSFHVTPNMIRGAGIFDLKFKGDRIAYEVSLNDISLIYASNSAASSNIMYTDAMFGLGTFDGVVPSVDCPPHATLLETSYYEKWTGTTKTFKSICVFESDDEEAEWRHNAKSYTAGMRKTKLVVRSPVTVGNYDYTVDFQFHIDGKLYTKAKATGAIQAAFWDPEDPYRGSDDGRDAFGFRVSDYSHGSIHDHMFSFKVDLDILDSSNSFERIHFKSGDVVDALNSQKSEFTKKPEYFLYNVTRYLEYETVQQETGYRINLEQPTFWTVVNEKHRNQWGAKRGYQIAPLGTAAQTMVDSHPGMQAISFSKYHCAVTKHKDSEQWSNSILDGVQVSDPVRSFDKRLDGESIVNEDLVNWVSVGFLHIPTAEDVPMTVAVETGFLLKPFNFFNRTDVFDMPQYMDTLDYSDTERPPSYRPCLEDLD